MSDLLGDYWANFSHNEDLCLWDDGNLVKYGMLRKYRKLLGDLPVRVLEVGCGNAKWLKTFAETDDRCGNDLVIKDCEGFKAIIGDCRNLPIDDNQFDLVFSWGVVEHFPETEQAIKEHFRVCKVGGYVIIEVLNKGSLECLERFVGNIIHHRSQEYHMAVNGKYMWKDEFEKMFAGQKIIESIKFRDVFTKPLLFLNKHLNNRLSKHFGTGLLIIAQKVK